MNNIFFNQLPDIIGGKLIQLVDNTEIHDLITDSRKASPTNSSVFFAILGRHQDGHKFINDLYKRGCRQFIVEREIDFSLFPEANFLLVSSSLGALQKLVSHHRNSFTIPVIGITGSNGKTIIKEWLSQLLSPEHNLVKNPGSYNSQLGVPLAVWQMDDRHTLGIFEAGISRRNEMDRLESIIKPTLGIFSNVLAAHDEGFHSKEEKAKEKARLFLNADVIVYCKNQDVVEAALYPWKSKNKKLFSWGVSDHADVKISKLNPKSYRVEYSQDSITLTKEFTDQASWENLFHCVTTLIYLGYSLPEIKTRTAQLKSLPMRMELKAGINGSTIIDDSYSNDLAGLSIALDFFESQRSGTGLIFLSDMLDSGLSNPEWIDRINALLVQHKINKLVAIGPIFKKEIGRITLPALAYESVEECLRNFLTSEVTHATVLIKGARSFHLEQIVQLLQRKVHGTVMEIDLNAVVKNLNAFRARLKPETKIMAMVKAFAYGSGSNEVASVLQYHQVDYLGVAYADEGKWLRSKGIYLPIMVMNPSAESLSVIVENNLEPSIYSLPLLQSLVNHLQGAEIFIHLKLDTGMHRLGFENSALDNLIQVLRLHRNIKVRSIYSHLSGSDEALHDDFTHRQVETFNKMFHQLSSEMNYPVLRHILNSAGISRLSQFQFDMVRLGIGLYGIDPGKEISHQLFPAVTLRTTISQIKKIATGETVGYGRHGKSKRATTIATLAIGYADGFSRAFSRGVGKVLIKNQLAPVVGNVCMDMTMVDITGIEADEGDEVIIFGKDLPVTEVARWINTIPYEILTSTSDRVKRVFFAESI